MDGDFSTRWFTTTATGYVGWNVGSPITLTFICISYSTPDVWGADYAGLSGSLSLNDPKMVRFGRYNRVGAYAGARYYNHPALDFRNQTQARAFRTPGTSGPAERETFYSYDFPGRQTTLTLPGLSPRARPQISVGAPSPRVRVSLIIFRPLPPLTHFD